jgi:hypothetical protein
VSYEAQRAVLDRSEARLTERFVLFLFAFHANLKSGISWPSVATIAHEARLAPSTVRAALRNLEAAGELVMTKRGGGRWRTNHYRLGALPTAASDKPETHRPVDEFRTAITRRSVGEFLARKTHRTANENPPNRTPKPTDGSVPKVIERKNESAPPAPLAAEGGCASGARVAPIEEQRDNVRKLRQRLQRRSTQDPPLRTPEPSAKPIGEAGESSGEESDRRSDGVPPESDPA